MEKRLYSIRGATCCENTKDSIISSVGELCKTLFARNNVSSEDLVNIQFTVTGDLDALNPATALRNFDTGIDTSATALFCAREPDVKGMMPKTVRVMVTCYLPAGTKLLPVYMNGTDRLRSDWRS